MTADFPRPNDPMMAARIAAFSAPTRRLPFDRVRFLGQDVTPSGDGDCGFTQLVDGILDRVSTPPDGVGPGYCLVYGLSKVMAAESVRQFSVQLFEIVWDQFRSQSSRISDDRVFYLIETLTNDGQVDPHDYGSSWTFKPPHADRNGVLFAHVYGPNSGYRGGAVLLVDALSYAKESGLTFDEVMTLSKDSGPQKPVLRAEHVAPAVAGYGRSFGRLSPDAILFVNNGPEGLLHGATELEIRSERDFRRPLHRVVVRERDDTGYLCRSAED